MFGPLFSRRLSTKTVKIVEVGPRDGLQNEAKILATGTKLKFIQLLAESGLKSIEAASFVSPKWVPQMADSEYIVKELMKTSGKGPSYPVLIPNQKGFDNFYNVTKGKMKEIAIFTSAKSLERLKIVAKSAADKGIRVRGYVSSIVKCPYDGTVSPDSVLNVSSKLLEMGCFEVSLGDTIGAATPGDIEKLLAYLVKGGMDIKDLAIHCHDTYGQALANILMSLQMGIRTVDSSCAGLGGCPYAPGASGNVATEDLVYMLNGLGIESGIDLNKLIEAGKFITREIGMLSRSKVAQAYK